MRHEVTKYGWKYTVTFNSEGRETYSIEPPEKEKRPIPKSFFKYYGLTKKSVDAFCNCYLYASHPKQMNDLLDCSEVLVEIDSPGLYGGVREYLGKFDIELGEDDKDVRNMGDAKSWFCTAMSSNFGVVSLAEEPNVTTLWGYYTNNVGFCVELKIDNASTQGIFHGPFQVNYRHTLETLRASELWPEGFKKDGKLLLFLIYLTNIKHSAWEYENEWRFVVEGESGSKFLFTGNENHPGRNREFGYQRDCLKSVTFGNKFFEEVKGKKEVVFTYGEQADLKRQIVERCLNENIEMHIIRPPLRTFELQRVRLELKPISEGRFIATF